MSGLTNNFGSGPEEVGKANQARKGYAVDDERRRCTDQPAHQPTDQPAHRPADLYADPLPYADAHATGQLCADRAASRASGVEQLRVDHASDGALLLGAQRDPI